MRKLVSLAVVVAFFVAIPQCFGQDACLSPAQLLEEQQPLQMSLLVMMQGPGQSDKKGPGCIKLCGDAKKAAQQFCRGLSREARAKCREDVEVAYDNCTLCCHSACRAEDFCVDDYSFCCADPTSGDPVRCPPE